MNENSINNHIIKNNKQKGMNENQFINNNIALVYDIIKELEKDWDNKNKYNEIDKNKIHSLFSLLYFELIFLQQICKIKIMNKLNKNDSLLDNIINYNKEMLSKKIEQFLLLNNDKNYDFYKNQTQYSSINSDNNIKHIISKLKNNSCLKTKYNNFIKNTKKLNDGELTHKSKKYEVENYKNDISKIKTNNKYLFESIYKSKLLNKTCNKNVLKKKKTINNIRNVSSGKIKINKSNDIKNLILDRINNSNKINNENYKCSNKDDKKNKTINNFNNKPKEIHINKSKDNISNNDISLFSNYDEKDSNPIRKVKNIIIKVKYRNMTMECKNSYYSNKEKENEINKKENENNNYKKMSKSGYLFSHYNEKNKKKINENVINNLYYKERETKEILYDCMNQIQKKLNSCKYNSFKN